MAGVTAEVTGRPALQIVCEVLKHYLADGSEASTLKKFGELYQQVLREQTATSVHEYIDCRKAVGRLTAELSYLLIRPVLRGDEQGFCSFMMQVGEVGCLVDSLIDLASDYRLSLLGFAPSPADYGKLAGHTLQAGLRLLCKYPGLVSLFWPAVVDNLRDRGQRSQAEAARASLQRKERVEGVA